MTCSLRLALRLGFVGRRPKIGTFDSIMPFYSCKYSQLLTYFSSLFKKKMFGKWTVRFDIILFCVCICVVCEKRALVIMMYVWMCPTAGSQLPSPSYSTEKTEQTQQLPLSMDQLLGTSAMFAVSLIITCNWPVTSELIEHVESCTVQVTISPTNIFVFVLAIR